MSKHVDFKEEKLILMTLWLPLFLIKKHALKIPTKYFSFLTDIKYKLKCEFWRKFLQIETVTILDQIMYKSTAIKIHKSESIADI